MHDERQFGQTPDDPIGPEVDRRRSRVAVGCGDDRHVRGPGSLDVDVMVPDVDELREKFYVAMGIKADEKKHKKGGENNE